MSVTEPGTPESLAPQPAERHILCVDDDLEFLKSLEFFLPDKVNQGMGEHDTSTHLTPPTLEGA